MRWSTKATEGGTVDVGQTIDGEYLVLRSSPPSFLRAAARGARARSFFSPAARGTTCWRACRDGHQPAPTRGCGQQQARAPSGCGQQQASPALEEQQASPALEELAVLEATPRHWQQLPLPGFPSWLSDGGLGLASGRQTSRRRCDIPILIRGFSAWLKPFRYNIATPSCR